MADNNGFYLPFPNYFLIKAGKTDPSYKDVCLVVPNQCFVSISELSFLSIYSLSLYINMQQHLE